MANPLDVLYPSEREAVLYYLDGLSTNRMAEVLEIKAVSAEKYIERAKRKLGVRNREELTRLVLGVVPSEILRPALASDEQRKRFVNIAQQSRAAALLEFADYLDSLPAGWFKGGPEDIEWVSDTARIWAERAGEDDDE